jgi:heme/copper-type cytochrome/quinol oxidase subunit 4
LWTPFMDSLNVFTMNYHLKIKDYLRVFQHALHFENYLIFFIFKCVLTCITFWKQFT